MVRVAIAYSLRDPAGSGAASALVELFGGGEAECGARRCHVVGGVLVGGFQEDSINLEMLDHAPDPEADAVIVLSRHRSEAGRKSLTVHHPGNPTNSAPLGGEPGVLATSYPALAKLLLASLKEAAEETGLLETHEVTLEATHHGPTKPSKPIVFVELGSTEEDWANPRGWETLALAVHKALTRIDSDSARCKPAAGFGGGHYPLKHTRLQLEDPELCIGHVIPKYAFQQGLAPDAVRQALTKSYPSEARAAVIEKKSLKSAQRRLVEEEAEALGAEILYV